MRERIVTLVPDAVREPMRLLRDTVMALRQSRVLDRAVAALRREARAGAVSPALWPELRGAWGNEAYSADSSLLAEIAARALSGGPTLECGSGLTTLVLGVIADESRLGGTVWSLEQDGRWHRKVSGLLARFDVRRVTLWHAPLRARHDYVWYDLMGRELPRAFVHVVCDGPAVHPEIWPEPLHAGWRMGVVPELLRLGIRFDEADIVLDDADDPRCPGLRKRWEALGLATRIVETPDGSFLLGQTARRDR